MRSNFYPFICAMYGMGVASCGIERDHEIVYVAPKPALVKVTRPYFPPSLPSEGGNFVSPQAIPVVPPSLPIQPATLALPVAPPVSKPPEQQASPASNEKENAKKQCEKRYEQARSDCLIFVGKSDKPDLDASNFAGCLRMNGFEGYSTCNNP